MVVEPTRRSLPERERRCADCQNSDICALYGKSDDPSCFAPKNGCEGKGNQERLEWGVVLLICVVIFVLFFISITFAK